MNLIDQLGGYEAAKNYLAELQKIPMHEQTEDTIVWLPRELLEYRREHNIYDVGDEVTGRDNFRIGNISEFKDGSVWVVFDSASKMISPIWNIRHATDEEIANNARSK